MSSAQPNALKALLRRIRNKLFHPPYYRAIRSSNPDNHLVFIEKVEKVFGFTFTSDVCYTSDMFAESEVKRKNSFMKSLYGEHDVYHL